jgi:SAM-dependent methyltransferase
LTNYYAMRLSGHRLRRCYELAPHRVKQYLDAEMRHVVDRVHATASVLELGCGYGRVLAGLVAPSRRVVGIDTSLESLLLARELMAGFARWELAVMDATALALPDRTFEAVVCIQNGICAFRCDPRALVREALRVTRPGGKLVFSSYSETFWPHRLQWFELQAADGLVGEIDYSQTRPGEIVCRDGFRSATLSVDDFVKVCRQLGVEPTVTEVDESSVFCEVTRAGAA